MIPQEPVPPLGTCSLNLRAGSCHPECTAPPSRARPWDRRSPCTEARHSYVVLEPQCRLPWQVSYKNRALQQLAPRAEPRQAPATPVRPPPNPEGAAQAEMLGLQRGGPGSVLPQKRVGFLHVASKVGTTQPHFRLFTLHEA